MQSSPNIGSIDDELEQQKELASLSIWDLGGVGEVVCTFGDKRGALEVACALNEGHDVHGAPGALTEKGQG
jgi:predicted DNA-binding protein with PD1-like motif